MLQMLQRAGADPGRLYTEDVKLFRDEEFGCSPMANAATLMDMIGIPSKMIYLVSSKVLMYVYLAVKAAFAISVMMLAVRKDLRFYQIAEHNNLSHLSIPVLALVIGLEVLQTSVIAWGYCWRKFLDSGNPSLYELLKA